MNCQKKLKKNSKYAWSLAKLKAVSNQPQKLLNFKYFDVISEGGNERFRKATQGTVM